MDTIQYGPSPMDIEFLKANYFPRHGQPEPDDLLKRPSDFGFHDRECFPSMFERWSLGDMTSHRDSDCLTRANEIALIAELRRLERFGAPGIIEGDERAGGTWCVIYCNHFAYGYLTRIAHEVTDEKGALSNIVMVLAYYAERLGSYPVLDDDLFSRMEYDETVELIRGGCWGVEMRDNLPDDWAEQVYGAISDVESPNPDNLCGDDVIAAIVKLGFDEKK